MHIFMQFFFISTLLPIFFLNVTTEASNITCGYEKGDSKVAQTIFVDEFGSGSFKSVQAAINSIPSLNNKWIKIQINSGTYEEQVTIPSNKPCIFLQGRGREATKITYNGHDRKDLSATFISLSNNVVVKGITFENSYNVGVVGKRNEMTQALAARIYGDKSAFYECGFVGLQDTLWDARNRHYFSNCYIEGAIDFIFGSGQSFYEDCSINATVGSLPKKSSHGVITAQGRITDNDPGGFVFLRGNVTSTGRVLLGRGYDFFSRVIFQGTNLLADVVPYGWDAWRARGREYSLTYVEEGCRGRGSNKSKRVSWEKTLTKSTLRKYFSKKAFIDQDGWIAIQPIE